MSNIGKQPITIPEGVEVSRKETNIFVKGKLGELNHEFQSDIGISINENEVVVTRNSDEKIQRELHGLTRVLIANMVQGVSQGFQKELNLVGVGYTADASKGNFLLLNVGYSHPIYFETPDGITTEWNEYWKGNLYGEEFQQALEKYGYEYTPPTEEEVRRFRLDSPFLHNEEDN